VSGQQTISWYEANQRYLTAALGPVREALERHAGKDDARPVPVRGKRDTASFEPPPALETLGAMFGLSSFERDVLLMCAGVELDSTFAARCAAAQDHAGSPTFGLALAALPDAHWSALNPASPLRRWRLIEVGSGEALTTSPLRISERVLHYLAGVQHLDESLEGFLTPVRLPTELPPSQQALTQRITDLWSVKDKTLPLPVIQLCGSEGSGKEIVAAAACAGLGLGLYAMRAEDIPSSPAEREALSRLWERESVLGRSVLLVDCDRMEGAGLERAPVPFVENVHGMVFVTALDPVRLPRRRLVRLDVRGPTPTEQRSLWQSVLGPSAAELNGKLGEITSQFSLGPQDIRAAGTEVLDALSDGSGMDLETLLWEACRSQARTRLDDLAGRIEPAAAWEDLVLPAPQKNALREIVANVRQRAKVYETWGFAEKGTRGLGISALFAGASGTGKTMAAEVLAGELRLDLYRIDLSQVVSKYIGETEKNLRRVFDAAEEGGAVLLFDEADALFGKRSEVKDSHDRYANIEVSYLLQRMESYRGLAILTTNMKAELDPAFLRRLRFVVRFPFPDAAQRARIWERIFPADTPTEGLDVDKLAKLNVAGGNIRNIALQAAFLAADEGEPVRMAHLLRAAYTEYAKLEKSLTGSEIGDWT
jgi:ATPase family associated with various cellular activities (AAA)